MRYQTMNGSNKVPSLHCDLDKRGILSLKEWLFWLNHFVSNNTENLNISVKNEDDLLSLDLNLLSDIKWAIKMSRLIKKYFDGKASYQELLSITEFIQRNSLENFIILSKDELKECSGILKTLKNLTVKEVEQQVDKMNERFDELTVPEIYALYEMSMGSIRREIISTNKKNMMGSLNAYLNRIEEESCYSRKIARKDKVHR